VCPLSQRFKNQHSSLSSYRRDPRHDVCLAWCQQEVSAALAIKAYHDMEKLSAMIERVTEVFPGKKPNLMESDMHSLEGLVDL
jgi:hypothetical protein